MTPDAESKPLQPIRPQLAVTKVDNTLDLEQLLTSISQSTARAAEETGAQQPSAELAQSLKKVSELASQLSQEMATLRNLEPAVEQRVARVSPPAQHTFRRPT